MLGYNFHQAQQLRLYLGNAKSAEAACGSHTRGFLEDAIVTWSAHNPKL